MTEAVIVSTARTPIGKAYKGALNNTEGATLMGHAISAALSRANLDGGEVEDVMVGCAMQQGTPGTNIAHKALLRACLLVTFAGTQTAMGGHGYSISLPQSDHMNLWNAVDPELVAIKPDAFIAMLDPAEV